MTQGKAASLYKILLVDDHPIFREALKALMSPRPEFVVVGETGSGEEALVLVKKLHPDLVLMDIAMPGQGGLRATKQIKDAYPAVRVLILSASENDSDLYSAIETGAQGYLLKMAGSKELLAGISAAARGEEVFPASLAAKALTLDGRGRTEAGSTRILRVLMIDFNPVVRAGLEAILARDHTIRLSEVAQDAQQGLLQLREASAQGRPINVVLSGAHTSTLDGVQVTRLVKAEFPDVAVLVLTPYANDSHVIDAIQAGAGGYLFLNDMVSGALLKSIHHVVEGGTQMKAALLRSAVEALAQNGRRTLAERTADAAHLTEREVEVLRLMGNGEANKAIAEALDITLDTVKKHVRNVIDKLQAKSRTHAAIIAAQAGIVGPPLLAAVPPEAS